MYVYQYALVKYPLPNVRIVEEDVSTLPIKGLLRNFLEVYLVLKHPTVDKEHTLLLSDLHDVLSNISETLTVQQWLIENGNDTLPTTLGKPVVSTNSAVFKDVWQSGFVADLCVPVGSPLNDSPDVDKTDIWLTRNDTDYVDVQRHCLSTVNGYVHRIDADGDGVYIKDGGVTFQQSKEALLGLISFKGLGRVHTYDLTPEMIYHPNPTKLFSEQLYIKLPFDTTDKIVGVVIGGYLHLNTNDMKVIGPHSVRVDVNRIPLLERYMESRYKLDLSSIERFHEISEVNAVDYDLQGFYSNECILEMMDLSQSFIVAIDAENLSTEIINTTNTQLPGRFYYEPGEPMWPLRTELGLMPSYLREEENKIWVIRIDNNLRQHRLFETADSRYWSKVDEKRISGRPVSYSRGDLVKWSSCKVSITPQ